MMLIFLTILCTGHHVHHRHWPCLPISADGHHTGANNADDLHKRFEGEIFVYFFINGRFELLYKLKAFLPLIHLDNGCTKQLVDAENRTHTGAALNRKIR